MAKNPGPKLIDKLKGDYRNLPSWATNKLQIRVEKQNVDEKVEPDALGSGLISSSVLQEHTDERRKVNAYIDVTTLPISVEGKQRVADFGGVVATATSTITQEPAVAQSGFGVLSSEARPLGNGLVEVQTLSVTTFPIIQGVQIDSRYGVPFTYEKQIVEAGTSGGIDPDGLSATEIEPKDQWHSWRTTTSVGSLPDDQVWYGRKRENLPDVLIGLTIVGTERFQAIPQWRVAPDGPMKARFTRKFSLGPPSDYDPTNTGTVLRPEPFNILLEYSSQSVSETTTQSTSTGTSNNTGNSTSTTNSSGNSTSNSTSNSTTTSTSTSSGTSSSTTNSTATNVSTSTSQTSSSQDSSGQTFSNTTSKTTSKTTASTSGSNTNKTTSNSTSTGTSTTSGTSTNLTQSSTTSTQTTTANTSSNTTGSSNSNTTAQSDNNFQSDDYTNSSDSGAPTVGGGDKTFRYSSGRSISSSSGSQRSTGTSSGTSSTRSTTTSNGKSDTTSTSKTDSVTQSTSKTDSVTTSVNDSTGNNTTDATSDSTGITTSTSTSKTDSKGTSTSTTNSTSQGTSSNTSSSTSNSTNSSDSTTTGSSTNNTTGVQTSTSVTSSSSNTTSQNNSTSLSTSTQKTFFSVSLPKCLRGTLAITSGAGNFTIPATTPATLPFGNWLEVSRQSEHWKLGIWITEIVEVYLPAYV